MILLSRIAFNASGLRNFVDPIRCPLNCPHDRWLMRRPLVSSVNPFARRRVTHPTDPPPTTPISSSAEPPKFPPPPPTIEPALYAIGWRTAVPMRWKRCRVGYVLKQCTVKAIFRAVISLPVAWMVCFPMGQTNTFRDVLCPTSLSEDLQSVNVYSTC